MPRLKPPFPAQSGYLNEPSNINNVETFANVAWIIQHGGTAFAAMGTENSKGTKSLLSPAKSSGAAWWRFPWGTRSRMLFLILPAALRTAGPTKRCRWAVPPAAVSPRP